MLLKLKKGSIISFLAITIVLLAAFTAGGYFALNKLGIISNTAADENQKGKFQKDIILRSYDFKDSKGDKKKFIVVKKSEANGVPVADSYITDKNFSLSTAVKIEDLSGDSNLGYAASGLNGLGSSLTISASPGDKDKILLVEIAVGDAATITLIDEKGKIVSKSVVDNILKRVQDKCKCSFVFDSWHGSEKFSVKVPTQKDGEYRAIVNAQSGQLENGIEKI